MATSSLNLPHINSVVFNCDVKSKYKDSNNYRVLGKGRSSYPRVWSETAQKQKLQLNNHIC